ncbi:MAG: class I tRNA ligase family protein [Candidatus Parcubacteria bacterium]|nr:class I tRNA ligase family protein [Candidatus Parcubacteria bacterium]
MPNSKFYITTSIAYANAAPHMGHAYEEFLADVIARYKRDHGLDVFFLTGTDEHGTKICRTAEKNEMPVQEFVDKNAEEFQRFYASIQSSFDGFIRTSDKKQHWPGAQMLWKKLAEKGDIYKSKYTGLYCVGCEAFVGERDLVNGLCPNHNVPPEKVEEENYFFRLTKYADIIREKLENDEIRIVPEARKHEIIALIKEGVSDVSFSRPQSQIPWGIPVPEDPNQVMYVWCDALTNYISALGYGIGDETNFTKYWPADVHVIGKDILRFHALLWPAMLLSAEIALPKEILIHGFITSGGKKMSKSIGNVVDPKEFVEKYGSEALRSYFSRDLSPFEDGDFTEEKFLESYNANLANGIGNLVSRTIKMTETYFEGKVEVKDEIEVPLKGKDGAPDISVKDYLNHEVLPVYHGHMERYELNRATDTIWAVIKKLDGYVTDYEPYKLIKTDKEKTEAVLANLLYGIHTITHLLAPFMPETSKKIDEILGVSLSEEGTAKTFSVGHVDTPLFPRR